MKIKKLFQSRFFLHLWWWIFSLLFIKIIALAPGLVENIYAQTLYPVIAIINRWLTKWFPFSIGDLLYFWGIMYLIYQLIKLTIHFKKPAQQLEIISTFLLKTFWIFYLSWGVNYYRKSLSGILQIPTEKYTMEQLLEVSNKIIKRTNNLQIQLKKNDTLPVHIPYGLEHIIKMVPDGYHAIENITGVSYKVPCIKTSLFSRQISYMHVSGYLNPFTGEAQINKYYPKVFLPDIASHEVAHQLGFAPENEANFLGYLAATHHPDLYFKYAGNIDALYYLLTELKKADKENFKKYVGKINKGVLKNFREANEFTKRYQSPIDFSSSYDAYLKLNNQKSGIQSYNEMVQLLISYELSK